jgi:hypothetical protein
MLVILHAIDAQKDADVYSIVEIIGIVQISKSILNKEMTLNKKWPLLKSMSSIIIT